MNIIIVGAGKVGAALCESLSGEKHSITLIEQNENRLQQMLDSYNILGVAGNGSFYDTQIQARVETADMFISVTPSDEINLIACVIAKKLGAKQTVARVRTPEHAAHMAFMRSGLGITRLINPDLEAAQEIYRMLRYPSALSVEPFSGNRVNLVQLKVTEDSVLAQMPLRSFRQQFSDLIVCMVKRGEDTLIPSGATTLCADDRVFITGKPRDLGALYREMGTVSRIRSNLIIGGGRITRYLVEMLRDWKMDIKVIDRDHEVAESLAVDFPFVTVIEGDGTDQALLDEQHIENYDCVTTLTGIDEENILLSMFAAGRGAKRTITKVNRTNLLSLFQTPGIQSVITPAGIVTTNIVRIVRAISNSEGSPVEALYRLDNRVEALQFHVNEDSPVVGIPLKDLKIRKDTLIATILRDSAGLLFPRGDDAMEAGDHVLVVTLNNDFNDISDILE